MAQVVSVPSAVSALVELGLDPNAAGGALQVYEDPQGVLHGRSQHGSHTKQPLRLTIADLPSRVLCRCFSVARAGGSFASDLAEVLQLSELYTRQVTDLQREFSSRAERHTGTSLPRRISDVVEDLEDLLVHAQQLAVHPALCSFISDQLARAQALTSAQNDRWRDGDYLETLRQRCVAPLAARRCQASPEAEALRQLLDLEQEELNGLVYSLWLAGQNATADDRLANLLSRADDVAEQHTARRGWRYSNQGHSLRQVSQLRFEPTTSYTGGEPLERWLQREWRGAVSRAVVALGVALGSEHARQAARSGWAVCGRVTARSQPHAQIGSLLETLGTLFAPERRVVVLPAQVAELLEATCRGTTVIAVDELPEVAVVETAGALWEPEAHGPMSDLAAALAAAARLC